MTTQPRAVKSISGRRLGIGSYGQLVANGVNISPICVDATITVAAEVSDVRAISIQLKDANGNALDYAETVDIIMLLNAAGTDFVATGGSTGIAIGASGKLATITAKKRFTAISTVAGLIALTWTDTGTEVAYLGVVLPSGRMVISAALTNA
jgi:hypothetical protein